jgi:tRNA(Ile)-lysidine synthase
MSAAREEAGLLLARPLLALPKARLAATLRTAGIAWCEDPSNADERFQRARLRAARPTLDALGLDRERLTATARAMARAGAVIDRLVGELDASAVTRDGKGGWLSLPLAPLLAADEEIRLRLLSRLIAEVTAADYGPRLEMLEGIDAELIAAGPRGRLVRTLAGCRLELRRGHLWIAVELGRVPETVTLAPGAHGIWRGRPVSLAADAPASVTFAPLGRPARLAAARATTESPPREAAPPSAAVLETAPAVFVDGRLVACPALPSTCDKDAARWLERVKFR